MLTTTTIVAVSAVVLLVALNAVPPPAQPQAGRFRLTAAEAVAGTDLRLQTFGAGWHAETPTNHVVIEGNAQGLTRISVLFEFRGDDSPGVEQTLRMLRNVFPGCDGAAGVFRAAVKDVVAGKMDVLVRLNGQRAWLSLEPKSGWPLLAMTPT